MGLFDFFRTPEQRFENYVTEAFDNVIYIATHDPNGNKFISDERILHAIAVAYDATLKSEKMRNKSNMSAEDYEQFVKNIRDKVGRNKFNNWSQIVSNWDEIMQAVVKE